MTILHRLRCPYLLGKHQDYWSILPYADAGCVLCNNSLSHFLHLPSLGETCDGGVGLLVVVLGEAAVEKEINML